MTLFLDNPETKIHYVVALTEERSTQQINVRPMIVVSGKVPAGVYRRSVINPLELSDGDKIAMENF